MCSFKDGNPAKCWDDWQECKEKNCPLAHPKKPLKVDDAEVEQLSFAANGSMQQQNGTYREAQGRPGAGETRGEA